METEGTWNRESAVRELSCETEDTRNLYVSSISLYPFRIQHAQQGYHTEH